MERFPGQFGVVLAILCYLMAAPALAGGDRFEVGSWKGEAYYDKATGKFDRCTMLSRYEAGEIVGFSIFDTGLLAITIYNPKWDLEINESYPVTVSVDSHNISETNAWAIGGHIITIYLKYSYNIIEYLKKGRVLNITAAQNLLSYALTNTYQALPRLEDCVRRSRPLGVASANPFKSLKGASNPFASTMHGVVGAPHRNIYERSEIEDFLKNAGLTGALYVEPDKWPDEFQEAFGWADHTWILKTSIGVMLATSDAGSDSLQYASAILSAWGSVCGQNFTYALNAFTAIKNEDGSLADGQRVIVKCRSEDADLIVPIIFFHDKDDMLIIMHISDIGNASEVTEADERIFNYLVSSY